MLREIVVVVAVIGILGCAGCESNRNEPLESNFPEKTESLLSPPVSQLIEEIPPIKDGAAVLSSEESSQFISPAETGWNLLSYPMLPGFTISYPTSWSLKIKPMLNPDNTDPQWSLRPQSQIWVMLSQGATELKLVAQLAWDDNSGMRCSNSIPFTDIGNGWYRYEDSSEMYYTHNGHANFTTGDQPSLFAEASNGWEYQTDTQYAFCVDARSIWLLSRPPAGLGTEEDGGILMREPVVVGQPTPEQLSELDAIVRSIKNECVSDTCVWDTW